MEPVSESEIAWAVRYADVKPRWDLSRASLRRAVRHAVLSVAGAVTRFPDGPFLRCLYGHAVYDDQVEDFRRILRALCRRGTFVDTAAVVDMVAGRRPIDRGYFHLSFDDGFDNVYRNAFPVLRELGVPATVFVPTRFIGASDLDVVDEWWRASGVRRPTRPMEWSQLEEMARAGVDVGSHTRTHARLSAISSDPERLRSEIAGSVRDIEDRLGRPCRYFAWPWGRDTDVDERGMEIFEEIGLEACFSAMRGSVEAGRTHPRAIPRHQIEAEWPISHVRFFASGHMEARAAADAPRTGGANTGR